MSHCALAGKACACEILPHACPLSCNFFANRGPPCGMSASPSSEVAKGVTSMISRTSTAVASCHWVAASASLQPLQHGLSCFSNARKKIRCRRLLSVAMNSSQPTIQPENAIEFLSMMERLKVISSQGWWGGFNQKPFLLTPRLFSFRQRTPRTGWVRSGIQNPESVADHMYRMGVMGLLVNGTEYDSVKCLKLALVHDMAECESYLLLCQ